MLTNETASLDEVATALGRSAGWLQRHWLKLHLELGFPRKLPTGWVWPRRAVEAWLRAGGQMRVIMEPANSNVPDDILLAAAESLAERYTVRA